MFQRIWSAIFYAIIGALFGFVVTVVMAQLGITVVDIGVNAAWVLSACGAMFGLILGGSEKTSTRP